MVLNTPTSHLSGGDPTDEYTEGSRPNGLGLELAPFGLEKLYDYEQGGHHPVHLGDHIGHEGRYRVVHKLGNGGYANVWLCRDMTAGKIITYFAIKVLMAEVSTEECPELQTGHLEAFDRNSQPTDSMHLICLFCDHFTIDGPNGSHFCFVYPVLGPQVSLGLFCATPYFEQTLRDICFGAVKALDFLHHHGVCHGDGLPEEKVLEILGKPVLNKVICGMGNPHTEPSAPQYLVYPVDWLNVDTQYISKELCVIDFGESFHVSKPPDDLGIPGSYCSPELILENAAGFGSDLWALGCTLFEIRTGRKPFSPFDDDDDSYLDAMVQILGVLPEPWWSETWQERRKLYKDSAGSHGLAVDATAPEEGENTAEGMEVESSIHPSVAHGARSLLDMLAPGLWYHSPRDTIGSFHEEISNEEQEAFSNLLGTLLAYCPNDRTTARDALSHEWFR